MAPQVRQNSIDAFQGRFFCPGIYRKHPGCGNRDHPRSRKLSLSLRRALLGSRRNEPMRGPTPPNWHFGFRDRATPGSRRIAGCHDDSRAPAETENPERGFGGGSLSASESRRRRSARNWPALRLSRTFYGFHKPGKFAITLQQPAAFGIAAVWITPKSRLVVAAAKPPPKSRQRSRISAKLRKQRPGNARPLDAVWLGRKRARRNNARLRPGCSPCARAVRTSSPRVDTT